MAPNGDIYAVGRAKSSSQGDITQTNKGDFDALITKFNSLGELQ